MHLDARIFVPDWPPQQALGRDLAVCIILRKARTVFLLVSFALRSPTSPIPWSVVAKSKLMEALEPPAKMAQRIPSKARTVPLLASFALRAPTSPVPLNSVTKCKLIDAMEPPAEMVQIDLNDARGLVLKLTDWKRKACRDEVLCPELRRRR